MNVVVDASVALKWFIAEQDSAVALRVRAQHDIIVPDFLLIEFRNVLLSKVRRHELDRAEAEKTEIALDAVGLTILPSAPLLHSAFGAALDLDEPIYDCIYLAAALVTDRKLITADKKFVAKVAKSAFGKDRIELLGSSTA